MNIVPAVQTTPEVDDFRRRNEQMRNEREERRAAEEQAKADFRKIWDPVEIKPSATLLALHEIVFARESKRKPRWSIALAPDLAIRLQPQQAKQPWFDGAAFQGDGAAKINLDSPHDRSLVCGP